MKLGTTILAGCAPGPAIECAACWQEDKQGMVEEGLASREGFEPPTRCFEGRSLCTLWHRITHPERNPSSYQLKMAAMSLVMRKLSLDQQLAPQPGGLSGSLLPCHAPAASSSAPTASPVGPPPLPASWQRSSESSAVRGQSGGHMGQPS